MEPSDRRDMEAVEAALDAAERDARTLVAGLSENLAGWRGSPGSWSIAECLDHLATANRVYLRAMQPAAERAVRQGTLAQPARATGSDWALVYPLARAAREPSFQRQAHSSIQPRSSPALQDAFAAFLASQDDVRAFLRTFADTDLAGVRFPNPFVRGVRFSLATGLHVIAAHERRHLWQAWRVRRAAERAVAA